MILAGPACIPCLKRQVWRALERVCTDLRERQRIAEQLYTELEQADPNVPPPVISRSLHRRLGQMTGSTDPYRLDKARQNEFLLTLLPQLRQELKTADDPLGLAIRMAIAGNAIDVGAPTDLISDTLLGSLSRAVSWPVQGPVADLRSTLSEADEILYLADNAGEIVLDRLLIEQLPTKRVVVAVRGRPILNDATLSDAYAAGIHELAEIMASDSDLPGTLLADCSEQFRSRLSAADLVIAKGQGNLETLYGEKGPIWFLLQIKCQTVADITGYPIGSLVVLPNPAR
ncbi:MAG: ARMT1-like domain-containing protein [Sedimentisphaerales bacterium]|nr:ARMT1-like domain-containing protein [Sedimentisphaerales bacterium]